MTFWRFSELPWTPPPPPSVSCLTSRFGPTTFASSPSTVPSLKLQHLGRGLHNSKTCQACSLSIAAAKLRTGCTNFVNVRQLQYCRGWVGGLLHSAAHLCCRKFHGKSKLAVCPPASVSGAVHAAVCAVGWGYKTKS